MPCRLARSITPLRGWSFVIAVIKTKSSLTSNGVEDRADVSMPAERERIQGFSVFRRLMPGIGLASVVAVIVMSAEPTLSQTNIDQGKPASELFANYCAVCHKSTRGLANGRNSLSLSLFLREHYATSGQQAAA